jgi:glycosyltransferase involved in cell wall biosynthesis
MHVFFIALRLIRRRHAIHLLHAHFIFPQGLFGLILARLCRVPFVLSAVGDDVNVMLRRNAVLRTICRFLMAQADVTIAVSLPLQRALKQFGIANTVHLPNSVDTTTIFPGGELPKSASILFVGSMTTNKRPLMLLRAFERVVTEVPEATLTMCGDGPLMQAVQDRIRQNQLDGKVRLVPRATPESVIRLLSQADVFVLPSQSEGLSNALLEAMAAGRVIVASSNESHSEILRDGVDALLFRLDDEKDLAGQIVLSLTDDQVRSRLSRSARELCLRQFSAAENGPELEKIYLATVEKYHARKRKL